MAFTSSSVQAGQLKKAYAILLQEFAKQVGGESDHQSMNGKNVKSWVFWSTMMTPDVLRASSACMFSSMIDPPVESVV